jgi:hypothetical protein
MRYIRSNFSQMKTWQQRLMIVLVILVALAIVSSLTVELLHLRQRSLGNNTGIFQVHHGWTQVAMYTGTGNKTITALGTGFPHLWGASLTCEGKSVNSEVEGTYSTGKRAVIDIGISPCSASSSDVSPQSIFLDLHVINVRTIKVTASADTTWHLQFTRAINQPTLPLETEWVSVVGLGGSGNGGSDSSNLPTLIGPNGQTIYPRTYKIAFVCLGSGTATIKLTPQNGAALSCDGQVQFSVIHYPAATQLEDIQVSITSTARDSVWDLNLLGCTDEQRCGK